MSYIPDNPSTYQGNQVILNSDRLLFNAKTDSILLFSHEAIGFSTNGSFHFDTSNDEDKSKFVINSPNIYLGLEFDNTYPTQPAVLGNELGEYLEEMLDLIEEILNDMISGISYIAPIQGPTAPNPQNEMCLFERFNEIKALRASIESIKSTNTKLV